MDTFFEWLRKHAYGEWATVTHAPVLYAMAILLTGGAMFFLIRAYFGERISTLQATIDHRQSVLDDYQARLNGATPVEVATELGELKAQVGLLSKKLNRPQRRLSEVQRTMISALIGADQHLKNYNIEISSTPDTEATRFAGDIHKVLSQAGTSIFRGPPGRHDDGEYGLIFYISASSPEVEAVSLLLILEKSGLLISRRTDPENDDKTYIFVAPETD